MTELTLIHVPVSHYSEKARWALDYKRIPHTRRWPPGGLHPLVTFLVTRGEHQTVPALLMDDEGIGDSTEIIGPQIRQMAYHHLTSDPETLAELTMHQAQYPKRATLGVTKRILTRFLDMRFRTGDPDLAGESERKVVEAVDRLDAELDGREYLAGERFSVADLTAAALLYPLIRPPQTPWQPSRLPERWAELVASQQDRPAIKWGAEMYRRHR